MGRSYNRARSKRKSELSPCTPIHLGERGGATERPYLTDITHLDEELSQPNYPTLHLLKIWTIITRGTRKYNEPRAAKFKPCASGIDLSRTCDDVGSHLIWFNSCTGFFSLHTSFVLQKSPGRRINIIYSIKKTDLFRKCFDSNLIVFLIVFPVNDTFSSDRSAGGAGGWRGRNNNTFTCRTKKKICTSCRKEIQRNW